MPPQNPTTYTVESGRIQLKKSTAPAWLEIDAEGSFCIPLIWFRAVSLPPGHELEAFLLWSPAMDSSGWPMDMGAEQLPKQAVLQSLMYPARLDNKFRLCCALFSSLTDIGQGGRSLWVAHEHGSLSIWSNFAFQYVHGRLHLE